MLRIRSVYVKENILKKKNLSLMSKFFLTTLVVGVVIATVITVISAVFNIAASKDTARSSLGTISDDNARLCSEWLQQKTKQIKAVATTQRVINYLESRSPEDKQIVMDYLKLQSDIYGEFQNIFIADIDTGISLIDAKNAIGGSNVTKYNFWGRRYDDEPFIDNTVVKSISSNTYVFTISYQIKNKSGKPIGLVVLSVDWEKFAVGSFQDIKVGKTGYIYIIDTKAQFIFHPRDKSIILDGKNPDDFRLRAIEKKELFQRNNYKGTWKYLYSSAVPESGWIICATVNENELLSGSLTAMWISIILAFVILVVSVVVSFLIAIGVSRPITNIVSELSSSSSQIGVASDELSGSSQEIANGATEQASSIEETTASMEELASMVKQNVANAKEASILAEKTSEVSQNGHTQMEEMLASISDINKSSDEIRNIIDVIEDIAFQTNMLALNAAVEAARAGEAGMGFAVVADEVKNLANRSAESAKETAKMIKESINKTESGLDTAKRLAETFKEILLNTKKLTEMSKEVETASKQQDIGISQVNKAIIQFDNVVQSNASSAEETASSAEELMSQVEMLNGIVENLFLIVTGGEYEKSDEKSASGKVKSGKKTAKPVRRITYIEKEKKIDNPKLLKSSDEEEEKTAKKISFEDDEEFIDK